MKFFAKSIGLVGSLLILSGCASAASTTQSESSSGDKNEGFLRACLWFKNQDGYATMAESFYSDKRSATLSSWTDGLAEEDKTELESFFAPYNEKWARGLVIDMAFDDSPKESTEWINIQIKCLANDVEVEFPNKPY